ncbi:MAG TPA: hypothetical protein VF257_15365 [Solirubrobacteraceae bacterium]
MGIEGENEWRQNPRAYEEEVLSVLKGWVRAGAELRKRDGKIVRDVRLEGSYPDTRIVVVFDDIREPVELGVKRTYKLWEGDPDHPEIAGGDIDIAIQEE